MKGVFDNKRNSKILITEFKNTSILIIVISHEKPITKRRSLRDFLRLGLIFGLNLLFIWF